jgi:septum formation protein
MPDSIVLASSSPRRALLLQMLGVAFRVDVSAVEEDLTIAAQADERARDLALAKARAVAQRNRGQVILAADTLIAFRGRLLGKPRDAEDAVAMLQGLRAVWHDVLTGVAVVGRDGAELVTAELTRVLMRQYSDEEIHRYVASGDPMDKAAAYAIQHRGFHPVEQLDVCYTNVMGLPLCAVTDLLVRAGVAVGRPGDGLRSRACSFCQQAR